MYIHLDPETDYLFLDTTNCYCRIFPKIFCDLTFIEGKEADGNYSVDHFFKNKFELLPDCIIKDDGVKSYSEFIKNLTNTQVELTELFKYIDGISPTENRNRWTRLHLLHLTIIVFLNNYGYDFQQTNETKLEEVITKPKISPYLKNYFTLLNEYHLDQNVEIKKLEKIAKQYIEFH